MGKREAIDRDYPCALDHSWAKTVLCQSQTCSLRSECVRHDGGVTNYTRFYFVAKVDGEKCPVFVRKP